MLLQANDRFGYPATGTLGDQVNVICANLELKE
jgi:hypothetical protein